MTEALAAAEAPPRRPRGRPRKPPEALDEGNRRQKLLRVAARLFRRKGFDATTTRDIAAAAGMRSGSPFYHFESKAALLCAVVEQGMRAALQQQAQALQFRRLRGGRQLQLPAHDVDHVRRHARMVGGVRRQLRQRLFAQEQRHRGQQILHVGALMHQAAFRGRGASSSSRSISASDARRPMAARSALRSAPLRYAWAIDWQITPHFSVPSTSQ